jgi:DNA invertase Pin-like site-specific DNA recombinase
LIDHLRRLAIVYCRRSTEQATGRNTGSAAYQTDLAAVARSYGWTDDQIQIIDEDLGKAGSSSVQRAGWHRLQDMIEANEVGAVFVVTTSRLSRQVIEFEVFRLRLALHKTLLHTNGRFIDLTGERDRIVSELVTMRDRWVAKKRAMAGKRHAAISRRISKRPNKLPRPVRGRNSGRGKKR